jgi:hypothetical protein
LLGIHVVGALQLPVTGREDSLDAGVVVIFQAHVVRGVEEPAARRVRLNPERHLADADLNLSVLAELVPSPAMVDEQPPEGFRIDGVLGVENEAAVRPTRPDAERVEGESAIPEHAVVALLKGRTIRAEEDVEAKRAVNAHVQCRLVLLGRRLRVIAFPSVGDQGGDVRAVISRRQVVGEGRPRKRQAGGEKKVKKRSAVSIHMGMSRVVRKISNG